MKRNTRAVLKTSTVSSKVTLPQGFELDDRRHGLTILTHDYPDAWAEIRSALDTFQIGVAEAVAGGQGKTKMTARLEVALEERSWCQEEFETKSIIRRVKSPAIKPIELPEKSHEIDLYRSFPDARKGVALEIEWNNKDTFFDRDLANFERLHTLGVISVGIIITRAESLQQKLQECFLREYTGNPAFANTWLKNKSTSMNSQAAKVLDKKKRLDLIARSAFSYKYGATTTHWGKLRERLDRDMGAPCPLVLIGIGAERLITN